MAGIERRRSAERTGAYNRKDHPMTHARSTQKRLAALVTAGLATLLLALAFAAPSASATPFCGGRIISQASACFGAAREQPSRLQRERFALLRTRPEGLPARLRNLVRTRDASFNPALAQRIPVLLPGGYWLVPDAGQLCVVSEVPGTPGAATVLREHP